MCIVDHIKLSSKHTIFSATRTSFCPPYNFSPFLTHPFSHSPLFPSSTEEIATYLTDQESYWNVVGVASEDELVYQLTTHSPPHPPITLTNEINGVNITQEMGCFLGGAGMSYCTHYAKLHTLHTTVCT